MLTHALSTSGSRIDSKFVAAYVLPAFVGFLGSVAILFVVFGPEQFNTWRQVLDSVEKTLGAVFVIMTILMAAFFLRTFNRPIAEAFAGRAMPRIMAAWATEGQRRARRIQPDTEIPHVPAATSTAAKVRSLPREEFPALDANLQPTRFGIVLASAAEHPKSAYLMEATLCRPRLQPLLPGSFRSELNSVQSPMMAMLNLCLVFAALGSMGGLLLGFFGGSWTSAIAVLVGRLLISWICYRAALRQAVEFATTVQVGFDLYRHETLRMMDLAIPADLAAKRGLWHQLTSTLYGIDLGPKPAGTPGNVASAPDSENAASGAPNAPGARGSG